MEPIVLPNQLLCKLSLNTAWLLMHSPYSSHLREIADESCHAPAMKHAESRPPSVSTICSSIHTLVVLMLQLPTLEVICVLDNIIKFD